MATSLTEFEETVGLTPQQASLLLAIPLPTYYQYRRSDVMPGHVRRLIEVIALLPPKVLNALIKEHVFDA